MAEYDTYVTGAGEVLRYCHTSDKCAGDYCPIHNPSPHAESIGYTSWRYDRKIMERICEHGVGHPDPDDINIREGGYYAGVHGCDGCCNVLHMAQDESGTYGIPPALDENGDVIRVDNGSPVSYKESWNDLKSAIKGVKQLYGDDEVSIELLLAYMEKKEKRMQ